jgi:hypothetical protein
MGKYCQIQLFRSRFSTLGVLVLTLEQLRVYSPRPAARGSLQAMEGATGAGGLIAAGPLQRGD